MRLRILIVVSLLIAGGTPPRALALDCGAYFRAFSLGLMGVVLLGMGQPDDDEWIRLRRRELLAKMQQVMAEHPDARRDESLRELADVLKQMSPAQLRDGRYLELTSDILKTDQHLREYDAKVALLQKDADHQTDPSTALMHWTLYKNRRDFINHRDEVEGVFQPRVLLGRDGKYVITGPAGLPGNVPKKNTFRVDFEAGLEGEDSFATTLENALRAVEKEPDPRLVISLSSHGNRGELCHQGKDSIPYERLMQVLQQRSIESQKRSGHFTHIVLLLSACYSGSAVEAAKQVLQDPQGPFENGSGGKFRIPLTLVAESTEEQVGYWDHFLRHYSKRRQYTVNDAEKGPFGSVRQPIDPFLFVREHESLGSSVVYWQSSNPEFASMAFAAALAEIQKGDSSDADGFAATAASAFDRNALGARITYVQAGMELLPPQHMPTSVLKMWETAMSAAGPDEVDRLKVKDSKNKLIRATALRDAASRNPALWRPDFIDALNELGTPTQEQLASGGRQTQLAVVAAPFVSFGDFSPAQRQKYLANAVAWHRHFQKLDGKPAVTVEFGKRYRDLALREYDLLSENLASLRTYFSFNSMDDVAALLKQAPETFTQMDLDALLKEKDVAGRLRHYERALPPARYQELFRTWIEKK